MKTLAGKKFINGDPNGVDVENECLYLYDGTLSYRDSNGVVLIAADLYESSGVQIQFLLDIKDDLVIARTPDLEVKVPDDSRPQVLSLPKIFGQKLKSLNVEFQ